MIRLEELKRKAANWGVSVEVVERDYVLNWMLKGLFDRQVLARGLVFKGATALRKLYFPAYRFSEDLDFTVISHIEGESLKQEIAAACGIISEESGIGFELVSFRCTRGDGEEAFEGKVEYRGPVVRRGSLPRIKLDITFYEVLVLPPEKRPLFHPYSDDCRAVIIAYLLEEVIAEKMRTLLSRPWARHVYDLWQLLRRDEQLDAEKIISTFHIKCQYKSFVFKGVGDLIRPLYDEGLERSWQPSLGRQVRDLPDFTVVREELTSAIQELFLTWVVDTEKLGKILQDAGYDVLVTDVVYGRKETRGIWEVFIDGGGRLRFVATSTPSPPRGGRVTRGKRRYSVLQEDQRTTNIVCQLTTEEELGEVIKEIEALATGPSPTSGGGGP